MRAPASAACRAAPIAVAVSRPTPARTSALPPAALIADSVTRRASSGVSV